MNAAPTEACFAADPLRTAFREAARFWERARFFYNGAQLLVTAVLTISHWPDSKVLFTEKLGCFAVCVVISNGLFCLAYVADMLLAIPAISALRSPARWSLLIFGTVIACTLAIMLLEMDLLLPAGID